MPSESTLGRAPRRATLSHCARVVERMRVLGPGGCRTVPFDSHPTQRSCRAVSVPNYGTLHTPRRTRCRRNTRLHPVGERRLWDHQSLWDHHQVFGTTTRAFGTTTTFGTILIWGMIGVFGTTALSGAHNRAKSTLSHPLRDLGHILGLPTTRHRRRKRRAPHSLPCSPQRVPVSPVGVARSMVARHPNIHPRSSPRN